MIQDGKKIDETKLANGTTEYAFTDLDKYGEDGHIYEYAVTENEVDGYSSERNGYNFINTINQDNTISVSGVKTWIDPEGTEHPEITINLLKDGKIIDSKVLQNGVTAYSFTNLEKYAPDGHIYEYTVTENEVDGYQTKQEGNNFINTINQEKITISGTKTWIDPEDARHPTITINLLQDGKKIDETKLENGTTDYSFIELDKYAEDGHIYNYTVTENKVAGYGTKQDGFDFTNTINQEKITISGTKTWVDPEGTEHPEITINLLQDGEKIAETTIANGTTDYSFTNLDKYAEDGHIYEYTVTENKVDGYETNQNGYNFTNTIDQEKITISGTKTWVDPEGTEHPEITINLLQDRVKIDEVVLENGETDYSFIDLDKYAEDGHIYSYTVTENEIAGYSFSRNGFNIINTINQEKITVSGTKTWIDPEGTEHPEITINLLQDGEKIAETTIANETTDYSFTDLDKYAEDGHIYEYTVTENEVDGYESNQDGYNFTNTIDQEKITISGTKTWIAPAGITHPTITINLLQDGEIIDRRVLPNGTTDYSFADLDKYAEDGHIYTYAVTENEVDGYESNQDGYNFTNKINQEKITISGTKTWIDPDGTEHPEITINLIQDGKVIDTRVLPNGTTTYSFENLDKYAEDRHIYKYDVEEISVDGYTYEKNGYNITNTIKQEKISVNGTKTWVDQEGATNIQHPDITINLLQNGTKIKETTLQNGVTTYSFADLDKYNLKTGNEYTYTVEEVEVPNYKTTYDGYNITNTFDQDYTGTVTVITTVTSQTSVKNPLDVVFVLDISGSMDQDQKASKMVSAVNSAMKTILSQNELNRVGIATFSDSSSGLVSLKHYDVKDSYLNISWDNKNSYYKITSTVDGNKTVNVTGGTYTQSGIKTGSDMLTSASTTATMTVNGNEVTVKRTPIIILLTDGEPTYYSTNITNPNSSNRTGTGYESDKDENHYYYTIRTASACKNSITNHYFGNNGNKAKFYTIGFGMNATSVIENTVLNPNKTNIDNCNTYGNSSYGIYTYRNNMGKLYDKLVGTGTPYAFDYSDGISIGGVNDINLTATFNTIINENTTTTTVRDITVEESTARRVDLTGIDVEKEFSLKIGTTTYSTFESARNAGYIKGNSTTGYYVDFSNVVKGTRIEISYSK